MLGLLLVLILMFSGFWFVGLILGGVLKLCFTILGAFASLLGGLLALVIAGPILLIVLPVLVVVAVVHLLLPIAFIAAIVWLATRHSRGSLRTA